jgi:hypothetical protein
MEARSGRKCLGGWYSGLQGFGQAGELDSKRSAERPQVGEPPTAVGSVYLRGMIVDETRSTDQTLASAPAHREGTLNHLSIKVSMDIFTKLVRNLPGRAPGTGGRLRGGR